MEWSGQPQHHIWQDEKDYNMLIYESTYSNRCNAV